MDNLIIFKFKLGHLYKKFIENVPDDLGFGLLIEVYDLKKEYHEILLKKNIKFLQISIQDIKLDYNLLKDIVLKETIEEIRIWIQSKNEIKLLKQTERLKNLKTLDLQVKRANIIGDIIPKLKYIKNLSICYGIIDETFNRKLEETELEELSFNQVMFHKDFKFKLNFKNLKKISLESCKDVDFESLCSCLKENDKTIEIKIKSSKTNNDKYFYFFLSLHSKTKLELDFIPKKLDKMYQIKSLKINRNDQSIDDMNDFIDNIQDLKKLDLKEKGIQSDENEFLLKIAEKMKNLKSFSFNIGFKGNIILLLNISNLVYLDIAYFDNTDFPNNFNFDLLSESIERNKNLTKLKVYSQYLLSKLKFNNQIEELTIEYLYEKDLDDFINRIQEFKHLKKLIIIFNNFKNSIPISFIDYFSKKSLIEHLEFSSWKLYGFSKALISNTNLKTILIKDLHLLNGDDQLLYNIFLYNYTLIDFKFTDPFVQQSDIHLKFKLILDGFIRRNRIVESISKFNFIQKSKDLYLTFS